jgi:2'-hydroxyisoflavone reductase
VKILVLGGTLFLGRHLVQAGLERDHDVTLFNRGRTGPDLFPEVEKLQGDRTRGGDVLAPEPRDQAVQLVHCRDLADWMIDMAERRETGVFNATGPERPLTMEGLLEAIREASGRDACLSWADERFLVESGVEEWSELPLWLAPGANPESASFMAVDVGKALAAGLRFRPLAATIRDTLEGADTSPAAGLHPDRERELLRA